MLRSPLEHGEEHEAEGERCKILKTDAGNIGESQFFYGEVGLWIVKRKAVYGKEAPRDPSEEEEVRGGKEGVAKKL